MHLPLKVYKESANHYLMEESKEAILEVWYAPLKAKKKWTRRDKITAGLAALVFGIAVATSDNLLTKNIRTHKYWGSNYSAAGWPAWRIGLDHRRSRSFPGESIRELDFNAGIGGYNLSFRLGMYGGRDGTTCVADLTLMEHAKIGGDYMLDFDDPKLLFSNSFQVSE